MLLPCIANLLSQSMIPPNAKKGVSAAAVASNLYCICQKKECPWESLRMKFHRKNKKKKKSRSFFSCRNRDIIHEGLKKNKKKSVAKRERAPFGSFLVVSLAHSQIPYNIFLLLLLLLPRSILISLRARNPSSKSLTTTIYLYITLPKG